MSLKRSASVGTRPPSASPFKSSTPLAAVPTIREDEQDIFVLVDTVTVSPAPGHITDHLEDEVSLLRQRLADQSLLLRKSQQENIDLRGQLETLRHEWQTSEDLFIQSQRDNEEKHGTIEQYKQYVKGLERLLDNNIGPTWKEDNQVTPLLSQSSSFSASTPLPKPSTRNSSTFSMSAVKGNKRQSRMVSVVDMKQLKAIGEHGTQIIESTPAAALEKWNNIHKGATRYEDPVHDQLDVLHDSRSPTTNGGSVSPSSQDVSRIRQMIEGLLDAKEKASGETTALRHQWLQHIDDVEHRALQREARISQILDAAQQNLHQVIAGGR